MPRGTSRRDEAARQGQLWTPAVWAGTAKLAAWFDASTSPITASSGAVAQWNDLSGNANHLTQSTAGQKPTFDPIGWKAPNANLPAITFDGAASPNNDNLALTSTLAYSGATGISAHLALQQDGSGVVRTFFSGISGSASLRFDATNNMRIFTTNVENVQVGTITLATGWHIVGMEAATNLSRIWADGQSETQTAFNPSFTQPVSKIGLQVPAVTEFFTGAMGEMVFSAVILNARETNLVTGYLAWKWGTVANLYKLHPFKNRPPLIGD